MNDGPAEITPPTPPTSSDQNLTEKVDVAKPIKQNEIPVHIIMEQPQQVKPKLHSPLSQQRGNKRPAVQIIAENSEKIDQQPLAQEIKHPTSHGRNSANSSNNSVNNKNNHCRRGQVRDQQGKCKKRQTRL